MLLEKPYLQEINLGRDGKFAKKPYFRGFVVVPKEPHPSAIVSANSWLAREMPV
jgi:hypothetical protein